MVYVMSCASGETKIGVSYLGAARVNDVRAPGGTKKRMVAISDRHERAYKVERAAHRLLADQALGGEWFSVEPNEAMAAVRRAWLDTLGFDCVLNELVEKELVQK